jgi:hypothetical protein
LIKRKHNDYSLKDVAWHLPTQQFILKYQQLITFRDQVLNKLAILAFALLLFFSTMLWYLANGSLNEYLKSQIELQGQHYSGQKTLLAKANFSSETGTAKFNQLSLANLSLYQAKHALVIDEMHVELSTKQPQYLLTKIQNITINKLTLNIEHNAHGISNVKQLTHKISLKLAQDYPELYPEISAKIYAVNNPELNAEKYAERNPQAGLIIEHTSQKKKRGKPQQKIIIFAINIKNLELNKIHADSIDSIKKHNIKIGSIGGMEGLVTNQIGGEVLLHLFKLVNE